MLMTAFSLLLLCNNVGMGLCVLDGVDEQDILHRRSVCFLGYIATIVYLVLDLLEPWACKH